MMDKGWKPMPVILKIIWIILVVFTIWAILSLGGIYSFGFEFMGFSLYGLYALNAFFVTKIALPVVLIIGMHQRNRFIWILALGYFILMAISSFACIGIVDEIQNKMLNNMPERPEEISEDLYYLLMKWSIILILIMTALFNLALMIMVFIKRKYFLVVKHLEPPSETELPS